MDSSRVRDLVSIKRTFTIRVISIKGRDMGWALYLCLMSLFTEDFGIRDLFKEKGFFICWRER